MCNKITIPTFLKWAGGKRRIIRKLENNFPRKIKRYFEPFLGGGSVFFYIKQKYNPSDCYISDINKDLINTYIAVRDKATLLMRYLRYFKKHDSDKFYYNVRESFNKHKYRGINRCAAFIYLNKTCFNGLYRVNSKNEFNVPRGRYVNPEIFTEETILLANNLLQGVIIKNESYESIANSVMMGDFIYLDPCYDPLTKSSFANYTPERFSTKDRLKLEIFIRQVHKIGAKVVLSNNDLPEVRKMYSDFCINEIFAPRSINSNGLSRGEIKELVICSP
ncbi:MAG: Dam family site-specific DNA-(adenine-N6)-methyltransferase [Spirochaetes bacterium]|nr:Dam family site-specific DNA-(adenine-N6)-methyltransferase [Spirochaetota bacterium]MCK5609152.1 Dam family site-specific DNA-(adenine-N6)-methyltransferase [Candidatus Pacearchaeota archaeon]